MGLDALAALNLDDAAPKQIPSTKAVCLFDGQTSCSFADLFGLSKVHDVVARQMELISRDLLEGDVKFSAQVGELVEKSFRHLSRALRKHAPKAFGDLKSTAITSDTLSTLMHVITLSSNTKVQRLGFEVARAIQESGQVHETLVKRRIMDKLVPLVPDMMKLRREFFRVSGLRELFSVWMPWNMTMDPQNLQVMAAVSDARNLVPQHVTRKDISLSKDVQEFHIAPSDTEAGILEEGRLVISFIKSAAHGYGKEINLPLQSISLNTVDVTSVGGSGNLLSCELSQDAATITVNFMKAVYCPLKYGTMGIDALAGADRILSNAPSDVHHVGRML